jgi:hypothetical protein
MKSKLAGEFCVAMAQRMFPDDAAGMAVYCLEWLDTIANTTGSGSHKYIPTDWLNDKLGLPQGAGVYGYVKFEDDSYLLRLCSLGKDKMSLAYWSGNKDENPKIFEINR